MRQRLIHRWLLIVTVAAWSLAIPWIGSARADDAQVTVVDTGGNQRTLSLDALGSGDVSGRSYTLRSGGGESALAISGFSPAAILEAAGIDPYGFSYLEVQRPAGASVLLSRQQALDPGAFPEGPPAIYATATGTGFLRPSTGPGDLNATDSFETPQGIAIVLRDGSPLQVRAHASTLRTRTGRPVTFTAVVDRAGAGEPLAYSWYFDDGSSSTGPRTRHRFSKRGSYDVVVGVTTPDDDAGASAVVTVQVGPPLAGPDRKGGGNNLDVAAPDHGAATGGGNATPGPATNQAAPTSTAGMRSHLCPHSDKKCERIPGKRRQPRPTPAAGTKVSGMLLGDERVLARPEPAVAPAARRGQRDGAGGGGLPGVALGLLATAGLLGLGAFGELRGASFQLFRRKSPGRTPRWR